MPSWNKGRIPRTNARGPIARLLFQYTFRTRNEHREGAEFLKAARIHRFGSPEVIDLEDLPLPVPAPDQVLVRVAAAGVGPWDALIRARKSVIDIPLPITLGSDFSGVVRSVGK